MENNLSFDTGDNGDTRGAPTMNPTQTMKQINMVTAVNDSTITLARPRYWTLDPALSGPCSETP